MNTIPSTTTGGSFNAASVTKYVKPNPTLAFLEENKDGLLLRYEAGWPDSEIIKDLQTHYPDSSVAKNLEEGQLRRYRHSIGLKAKRKKKSKTAKNMGAQP